jgi:hypothetical protein
MRISPATVQRMPSRSQASQKMDRMSADMLSKQYLGLRVAIDLDPSAVRDLPDTVLRGYLANRVGALFDDPGIASVEADAQSVDLSRA